MTATNHVKGWIGILMTEDFSFHWPTKPSPLYPKKLDKAKLAETLLSA